MRKILDFNALLAAVQKLLNDLLILAGLKDATNLLFVIRNQFHNVQPFQLKYGSP